ncbi:MAG TPA: hypothetical protein VK866_15125 [Acidimicrobiales bacterium]|nr:hypothetical protein [Acidimicrobiales bacterium]
MEGFSDGAVPVVSVGRTTVEGDDRALPAVLLDVSDRPDVADLARVHALEGVGDVRTAAAVRTVGDPADWLIRLDVAVDRPVRCRFHVVTGLVASLGLLRDVADTGLLVIATGEPEPGARWLAVEIDRPQLAEVLATVSGGG